MAYDRTKRHNTTIILSNVYPDAENDGDVIALVLSVVQL
jgi:hypothetical protein